MKNRILQGLVGIALMVHGCDKIDDPIPKDLGTSLTFGGIEHIVDPDLSIEDSATLVNFFSDKTWIENTAPDNSNRRFIVLEEFTGHTCINCPIGTREVVRLDSIHKERLIPIGIHAGGFARPRTGKKFTTDFRVEGDHEDEYLDKFNPGDEYPRGIVSRSTKLVTSNAAWGSQIDNLINDIPKASLELTTYYDSTNSFIRANCKVTWKETLAEQYSLQLFVLEDHIVDWQKDIAVDVEFYDHRHVLRKVVNGTFGKNLNQAVVGESQEIQYVFPFKEAMRDKKENIEVVAFIFNNDPGTETNDIIQGNAVKVLQK